MLLRLHISRKHGDINIIRENENGGEILPDEEDCL
jgi:hypothetical protein